MPKEEQKHTPSTYAIITLGCKVNQYEGQAIRERLANLGWRETPFRDVADLYIINTCTVTRQADETCRKKVRRALRANPRARVIVTGCAAETAPERFRNIEGVSEVLTRGQMAHLDKYLDSGRVPEPGDVFDMEISRFQAHTRAFMKIQDGCDGGCAYCIIPIARGHERSRPLERLRPEAERLVAAGHREIVLTGIHLGHYGRDLEDPARLADAARTVLEVVGVERVRLSSIEAMEVPDDLIELAATDHRFCPHFHLPLQSGDDAVLSAMGRRYTVAEFLGTVERVRARLDRPSITTDVMVGFPGETDEQFEHTLHVCQTAGFSRIHVFPFSPRPGTRAESMSGRVPTHLVRERESRLQALAATLALAYKQSFLGQTVCPIVEHRRDKETGLLAGWSARYVRVLFDGPDDLMGKIVPVLVETATAETLHAVTSHT